MEISAPSETEAQTYASEMTLPNGGQTEVKRWHPNRPIDKEVRSGKTDKTRNAVLDCGLKTTRIRSPAPPT